MKPTPKGRWQLISVYRQDAKRLSPAQISCDLSLPLTHWQRKILEEELQRRQQEGEPS